MEKEKTTAIERKAKRFINNLIKYDFDISNYCTPFDTTIGIHKSNSNLVCYINIKPYNFTFSIYNKNGECKFSSIHTTATHLSLIIDSLVELLGIDIFPNYINQQRANKLRYISKLK